MQEPNRSETAPIGLLPCAGRATRLGAAAGSKEVTPVGVRRDSEGRELGPKAIGHYLLERMCNAGIEEACLVLREEKRDIPAYFGDGEIVGMRLHYVPIGNSPSTPFTVDQAYPLTWGRLVAFGFPDMLFEPMDVFVRLFDMLTASGADVVLGAFPADRPQKVDMLELDPDSNVLSIVIKPPATALTLTWGIAVWTPRFTEYLHEAVAGVRPGAAGAELFVGDIVRAAINDGLSVKACRVSDQPFLDIGTPDDLRRALERVSA